jgi:SAM-dependent methyltransferase
MNTYQNSQTAKAYSDFLSSENGRLQQRLFYDLAKKYLPKNPQLKILDAGCGNGWLAKLLAADNLLVEGCDFSQSLLDEAKKQSPNINFQLADLNSRLPYQDSGFGAIILNMVAHDVKDLNNLWEESRRILQPNGLIIATVVNPYYAYPVGVWKRGLWGKLLRRKPKLKIRPYNKFAGGEKEFLWDGRFTSYFYPLSEFLNTAIKNGLKLESYEDLTAKDDEKFNLNYELHRFPTILCLTFKKL